MPSHCTLYHKIILTTFISHVFAYFIYDWSPLNTHHPGAIAPCPKCICTWFFSHAGALNTVHYVHRTAKSTILFYRLFVHFCVSFFVFSVWFPLLTFTHQSWTRRNYLVVTTGSSRRRCRCKVFYFVRYLAQWGCRSAEQQDVVMCVNVTQPPQDRRWRESEGVFVSMSVFLHLSGGFNNSLCGG